MNAWQKTESGNMRMNIRNEFHDTEVTLVARSVYKGRWYLTRSQVNRARRVLCGIDGCTCGGLLGQRGWDGLPGGIDISTDTEGGVDVWTVEV
jgi:hypothetical protein